MVAHGVLRLSRPCEFCTTSNWQFLARFDEKPDGETDFNFTPYHRELWRCGGCGHVVNAHKFDMVTIYEGAYWDNTYADDIKTTFDKIMNLPTDKSDNRLRVKTVNDFWISQGHDTFGALLDIGSGLAVFPAAMKMAGWDVTALDPDVRASQFACDVAGVKGVSADFMKMPNDIKYDLISLNKVLEHVPFMTQMLARTKNFLKPGGIVYIELPDAEGAMNESAKREEFFVEHYCAFSMQSLELLIEKAGLYPIKIERLVEPSSKYTLRAFLRAS